MTETTHSPAVASVLPDSRGADAGAAPTDGRQATIPLDVPWERRIPVIDCIIQLIHCLAEEFARRMVQDLSLAVDLQTGFVYRFASGFSDDPPPASLVSGTAPPRVWRENCIVVHRLDLLLCQALEDSPYLWSLLDPHQTALPALATQAYAFAHRLMKQAGVPEVQSDAPFPVIHAAQDSMPIRSPCPELSRIARLTASQLAQACAHPGPSAGDTPAPAPVMLLIDDKGTRLRWLDEAGQVVQRLRLLPFFVTHCEAILSRFAREFLLLAEARNAARTTIGDAWQRLPASLREACAAAQHASRSVCVHLCRLPLLDGKVPADLWLALFPGPTGGHPCATVSLHRAHREFVLQSPTGEYFYFPPCQIVARALFRPDRFALQTPMVRQPAGGYAWKHPYTGSLAPDPLDGAPRIGFQGEEAAFPPSADALALFPELQAGGRVAGAFERDLCLHGQFPIVHELSERYEADPDSADILALFLTLHKIGRLGLTTAHQGNTSTPRLRLSAESMPYPLNGRPLGPGLLGRLFPYNPSGHAGVTPASPPDSESLPF